MAYYDENTKKLLEDLYAFRSPINYSGTLARDPIADALARDPRLAVYVQGYSARSSLFACQLHVTYANKDVPLDQIVVVDSATEAEEALHKCVSAGKPRLFVVTTADISLYQIQADFSMIYHGFYANLQNMEGKVTGIEALNLQCMQLNCTYRIGKVLLNMMEKELQQEITKLSHKLFCPSMNDAVKAYVAHNYLAKTVEYDTREELNSLEMSYRQSAYGAIIQHKCVCQGFAEAYKRLLDTQGIDCQVVCGKIKRSEEYHAWNLVSFNGVDYYHVDVTWDSFSTGRTSDTYYGLSDRDVASTRLWTKRPFWTCNGEIDIKAIAKKQIADKKHLFLSQGVDAEYLEV